MSKIQNIKEEDYKQMIDNISPTSSLVTNCMWAFIVGGIICTIAQFINNMLTNQGVEKVEASTITSITFVFLGALLTGLDVYKDIGKRAGAGSIVPISGFANSIVAPAIEYKKEGYVFGVGVKIFTIAGPVILYGIISSVIVGIGYYIYYYIM